MAALSSLPDFDVAEDISSGLLFCRVSLVLNPFSLQRGEETLSHCVVPAIPFATHTARDPGTIKHCLIVFSSVLTAPIRVMDDFSGYLSLTEGHRESILPFLPQDSSQGHILERSGSNRNPDRLMRSIHAEDVSCIDLVFNVIQHGIITVGYNDVGLAFELGQIGHDLAAEKIASVRQRWFID